MSFKIKRLRAFVSVDPNNGQEGVIAFQSRSGWMPMVCADEKRFTSLYPVVQAMAEAQGIEVKVMTFEKVSEEPLPPPKAGGSPPT